MSLCEICDTNTTRYCAGCLDTEVANVAEEGASERDGLRAEVERLRGDNAMLLAGADADGFMLTQIGRERDRLAEELAKAGATIEENERLQKQVYGLQNDRSRLLAHLRTAAGILADHADMIGIDEEDVSDEEEFLAGFEEKA